MSTDSRHADSSTPRPVRLLAGFLLTFASAFAHASPWVLPSGTGDAIAKVGRFESDRAFDSDGSRARLNAAGRYSKSELDVLVRWGLNDRLMAGVKSLASSARYRDDSGFSSSATSLGDQELSLTYRFDGMAASHALAVQATVKFPAYGAGTDPASGDRQNDVELRLLAGDAMKLAGGEVFAVIAPGVRRRFGAPSDEARLDATLGWKPDPRWLVATDLFFVRSLQRDGATALGTNPTLGLDFDRTRLQLAATRWLDPSLGITVGAFGDVQGRNVAVGRGLFVGAWQRF